MMRKTLLSICFLLIALFAVDRMGGWLMLQVCRHSHEPVVCKINHLVENGVHQEVVLFGTSRCNVHYVPSILRDSLGLSVYNAGLDASNNIFVQYMALNYVLAAGEPRVICLEVGASDYDYDPEAFIPTSFFAPYLSRSAAADSVLRIAGSYPLYVLSHLYRFNSKSVAALSGLLVDQLAGMQDGYKPQNRPRTMLTQLIEDQTPDTVDSLKLAYVEKFITVCRQHSIRLIMMVSPCYTKAAPDRYDVLKQLAASYDVPFLDYHSSGLFHDRPDLFYDEQHLWDEGARAYTSVFAHDLKRILKKVNNEG